MKFKHNDARRKCKNKGYFKRSELKLSAEIEWEEFIVAGAFIYDHSTDGRGTFRRSRSHNFTTRKINPR